MLSDKERITRTETLLENAQLLFEQNNQAHRAMRSSLSRVERMLWLTLGLLALYTTHFVPAIQDILKYAQVVVGFFG